MAWMEKEERGKEGKGRKGRGGEGMMDRSFESRNLSKEPNSSL